MKTRLLNSPDIQYLTDKVFCNYEVESDKVKLLLTVVVHCGNELLTAMKEAPTRCPVATTSHCPDATPTGGVKDNVKEPTLTAAESFEVHDK